MFSAPTRRRKAGSTTQTTVESFNFIRGQGNVAGILAGLREQENSYRPFAMAAQGLIAERYFPGFALTHPMPLVPSAAEPRLWIGNAAKVATHNDPIDNVAVVAAGRRRFTLFPPSAEADLYMGPHDPTPAGARISMVHVTAPDLDRFPRFAPALEVRKRPSSRRATPSSFQETGTTTSRRSNASTSS